MKTIGSKPVEFPIEGISPLERLLRDVKHQAEVIEQLHTAVAKEVEKHRQSLPVVLTDVPIPAPGIHLSRRERQTLIALLSGSSEKQIARLLGLSQNTVHVYAKALHRKHDVDSRGELLARYISPKVYAVLRGDAISTSASSSVSQQPPAPTDRPDAARDASPS